MELVRQLRATFPMFALPVLMISAEGHLEDACFGLESGACGFATWRVLFVAWSVFCCTRRMSVVLVERLQR